MRLPDEPDIPPQINIVPMIDVIFAILTFFIMSTLFLTKQEGLPVNLPKATSTQKQSSNSAPITVSLDQEGRITLKDKQVNIDELMGEVKKIIGSSEEALVVINADEGVKHGQVIEVMDILRGIPGVKLAIATQKP
jgi:biopolymer transport protein ExbD